MFKGFLSGLFWGGMVGVLVLAVLSLYAPLPSSQAGAKVGAQAPAAAAVPDETVADETPEADSSDGGDDPVEPAPSTESGGLDPISQPEVELAEELVEIEDVDIVAAAEGTLETQPPAVTETAPEVVATLETPSFDDTTAINTVKLPQVETTVVVPSETPNPIASEAREPSDQPLVISDKPFDTLPVAVLKTSPDGLGFADSISVQRAPDLGESLDDAPKTTTTALVAPVISELAPKPVENPAVVRVATAPVQTAKRLPQIGGDVAEVSADTPIGVEVAPIRNPITAKKVKVVTGRLPTVGGGTVAQPITPVGTPEVETPSLGAITDHAAPFATNAQSLFSIVIVDVGINGIAREQLLNSSYPITIAIDPTAPNAAALMSEYRAAGIEVVALLNDLPLAASPSDVATAVSGYFSILDEAVAVMEPLDKRLQKDRDLLLPVLGTLSDTGHGLMTYAQGLNSTLQSAKRSGVPAAAIFRVLDAEGEKSAKIKRYLKRAAFNAGKDGSVVVVGRSYADTMTAILEWALESNDASISLAPISAILKAKIAQGS